MENKEKVTDCCMGIAVMKQFVKIGEAKEKLSRLLDDEYLQHHHFSKHSTWYESEYELEADKLDDCRRKFYVIHDQLWDVFGLLNVEDEE